MMDMRIGFVRVFVSDLTRALDFYTNTLGMALDMTDNENWAQFHAGEDISLAIERCSPEHLEEGGKLVGRFAGVTLLVDNIAETHKVLKTRGVHFTSDPQEQPWGGILAHFADQDGNVLTLMESREV